MVSGSGTSGDPYILSSFSDLELIGSDATYTLAKYYKLGADIDASSTQSGDYNEGAGWLPRGDSTTAFTGGFDGDGHIFSGLYINRPSTNEVGLFGRATNIVGIINLTLSGTGSITGQNYTGGIVGYASSTLTITNCTVNIPATGADYVGGILGGTISENNPLKVSGCDVNTTISGANDVGGQVGNNLLRHT